MVALVLNDERATRVVHIVTTPPPTTGEGGLWRRGSEGGGGVGPSSLAGPRFFIFSLVYSLLLWGHLKAGERVAPLKSLQKNGGQGQYYGHIN